MSGSPRQRETVSESGTGPSLHPIIDDPCVVVFDESIRRDLYERWLSDTVTVHTPTSCAEAKATTDETTAVALVRHELSAALRERIGDLLSARAPQSRVVFATTSHLPIYDTTPAAQAHLSEPVDRTQLRETVLQQARIAVYSVALAQYYQCTTHLTELRLDAAVDDRVREQLETTADALSTVVDGIGAKLTPEERHEVLDSIVDEDADDALETAGIGSKYRPQGCSRCDDARTGTDAFRDLGAYVWECKSCGAVYERSAAAHRRVAKR
ncbi:hypothetical protein [Haloarcula litorea]|uniref:hypothetical protein n=1 Tax=Haloarcula litorea TaxID=3032579 RepID=UPI0023E84AF9|nr:hypothetical protein [Halomicroarcula sp. GDY20]